MPQQVSPSALADSTNNRMIERFRRLVTRMNSAWRTGGHRGMWALVTGHYVPALGKMWATFWMQYAGLSPFGRLATRLAILAPLPRQEYYEKQELARLSSFGFVAPSVIIQHDHVKFGPHVFINDRVEFQQDVDGRHIWLDDRVWLGSECLLRTGEGGAIRIGSRTSVGLRCELTAYLSDIQIGAHVMIASNCRFFSYDHGTAPDVIMQEQPLHTKGPIVIEDDVWIGTGAIILSGVRIGTGAVIGAGSVVTRDVPPGVVAVGNPARNAKWRGARGKDGLVDPEHDALLVRTLDGTIHFWNKGAEYLYGWPSHDTLGKRSHNLLQTIFPEPLPQIEATLAHEGCWEGELVHIRRDGSRMTVKSRWELQSNGPFDIGTVIEINTVYS